MNAASNIASICQRNVVTVRAYEELTAAARLMREKHVGYLIVAEPDPQDQTVRPVGVLTDRDIVVAVVAKEADVRSLRVEDVMTRAPVVVAEGASIASALREMRRIGVRRVPVVDYRGKLVGVLSLDDVLTVLAAELQDLAGSIRNEQRIEGALRP
jgi:predicted transcriptional regulator